MKRFWYKSYVADILSPERMQLPDWLFRRLIEFEAFAADLGDDGLLPPVKDMAWILRPVAETKLSEALQGLSAVGEVELTPQGWRLTHFEERQRGEAYDRVKKHRERNAVKRGETDETRDSSSSSSLSDSVSESGGEGAGRGGSPPPRSASDAVAVSEFLDQDAGKQAAQSLLLQAASLAALPPSEVPRVEQVRAMTATYGAEKTLAELRAQRAKWCKTRGRNGKFYSPLNMGWVDRADQALAEAATPQEAPYDPMGPYYRYLERKALEEKNGGQDGST
jgi:hypothetical protein